MQQEIQRRKLLTRRAALLALGQATAVAGLAGRMYQLQIVDSAGYKVLADENRVSMRLLAPPRGRILDRFGVALAGNRQSYHLVIIAEQAGDVSKTLDALTRLIALDDQTRRRVLREVRQKHSFVPVVVRDNLSWDEMARVEVAIPELPGVSIEQGLTRNYPFGQTLAHILGYVGAVSERELGSDPLLELPDFRVGKSGIEKSRDLELRGRAGNRQVEVNALGRVVRELERTEPTPGRDVVSAVDMTMQDFVTRRCSSEESIACVALDAVTGEVLALVSSPSFDPAAFSNRLSRAMWQELAADPRKPLSNKAISGIYPPGSTFKPVVALAALEAGVLTPQTTFFCPGSFSLGNATFHCWKHGGHGSLRVRDAIKESCDVFFYNTALRLGIDRLAATARRFGYGAVLGLDIPGERPGLIPTRAWKLATTGTPWQHGETLIAGIGQGSVLATPLQIAVMAARLVTGLAVVPRLVRDNGVMAATEDQAVPDFAPLGFNPTLRALVIDGMNAVVNERGGTAYAARIAEPGMAMGGKSGTSQVRRISEAEREHGLRKPNQIPWKDRDHALFVGFAPVEAPRYVCATLVEHGGFGSEVAGPIVRDVLLEIQRRDPGRRVPNANSVAAFSAPTRASRSVGG
jgi:penicillin-binding protein 2